MFLTIVGKQRHAVQLCGPRPRHFPRLAQLHRAAAGLQLKSGSGVYSLVVEWQTLLLHGVKVAQGFLVPLVPVRIGMEQPTQRVGRVDEGTCFENKQAERLRGFESPTLCLTAHYTVKEAGRSPKPQS